MTDEITPPRPALYIFVNRGLGMSAGKIAAQVAQAAVGAWKFSTSIKHDWWEIGQHHPTYIMLARDESHLRSIRDYLEVRGFSSFLMIDEGMTEIDPITPTALAVEIVDKNDPHTEATFMAFQLYRDTVRLSIEVDR